jgi:Tc5 transposase DNA-binding domain
MATTHPIDKALADLATQEKPNFSATARKYRVERTTQAKRFKGQTVSHQEWASSHKQCLTTEQEKALIATINHLTNRGMPPTTRIVKNLAEEIRGSAVGKNWTSNFVRRNQDVLLSKYLKGIDKNRVQSEHTPSYELFFNLVEYLLLLL